MRRIKVLDMDTANQIAAGEVVESPASVVKELVENAIDAGAGRIVILLEDGGKRLIRVTDDGCGIHPEDVRLAFNRHATSKIGSAEDLRSLSTLGFRGEALPSIASVSRVELTTCSPGFTVGVRLVIEGGQEVEGGEAGCPAGTTVTVRDLFYNTPARRRRLNSASRELAGVSEVVSRLALAYPGIIFQLWHHGTLLLSTPGNGDLQNTMVSLFGPGRTREMLPLQGEGIGIRVTGYAGRPALARATRDGQSFFVNRRWVRSPLLRAALEDAYRTLLPARRFPAALLFIEVDPAEVDVNVHPAKLEVRFAREQDVYRVVRDSVSGALASISLLSQWGESRRGTEPAKPDAAALYRAFSPPGATAREEGPRWEQGDLRTYDIRKGDDAGAPAGEDGPRGGLAVQAFPEGSLSGLRVLGQVLAAYIVAEGPEGLFIVDQHAAHERVYYEQLAAGASRGEPMAQVLVNPVTLEMSPGELACWEGNREILRELGVEWESFGGNAVLVRSLPVLLGEPGGERLLRDLLDGLRRFDGRTPLERREEAVRIMAACKAAVKANSRLSEVEMEALLKALAGAAQPYTCPHGRPTVVALSRRELEKKFGRG